MGLRRFELLNQVCAIGAWLHVACNGCGRVRIIDPTPLSRRLGLRGTVGDLTDRMRCVACGHRETTINTAVPPKRRVEILFAPELIAAVKAWRQAAPAIEALEVTLDGIIERGIAVPCREVLPPPPAIGRSPPAPPTYLASSRSAGSGSPAAPTRPIP